MARIKALNAHDRPPEAVRHRYKRYQKIALSELDGDPGIVDLQSLDPDDLPESISVSHWMSSGNLRVAFDKFVRGELASQTNGPAVQDIPVFAHRSVSGLRMIPSLFPSTVQRTLLNRLLHRDLSNSAHQTNLHLHYDVTYPDRTRTDSAQSADERSSTSGTAASYGTQFPSFFQDDGTRVLHPKDPEIHRPISVRGFLEKKLRWVTLGGQYDWTAKVYPASRPPPFPNDVAQLLRAVFPETDAQAAIVNFYSAGDTLSVHRDVSEECDVGLISVSFGCDGLFLISHDNGEGCEIIRLRSGDAVYMDGPSRFAWHGVPKILPSTCPRWLGDWPLESDDASGESDKYASWKGWMSGKRINLNVRQMTTAAD